jgi:hypothetical protein
MDGAGEAHGVVDDAGRQACVFECCGVDGHECVRVRFAVRRCVCPMCHLPHSVQRYGLTWPVRRRLRRSMQWRAAAAV